MKHSVVLAVAVTLVGGAARAEEDWPSLDIVVTKAARPAFDLPSQVSVLESGDLERERITGIRRLSEAVPALHYVFTGSPVEAPLAIRGQGNYGIGDASVGTFVDGVAVSGDSMVNLDLLDIERVEVMSGPQTTLYGRNAVAGAINLVTRQPSPVPEARLGQFVGEGATLRSTASLSGPLDEDAAVRLALARTSSDGLHRSLQGQAVDADRSVAGRLSVSYWLNDSTQALPSLTITRRQGQAYPYRRTSGPADYEGQPYSRDQRNPAEIESSLAALHLTHLGGDWVLSSISALGGTHERVGVDADYSAASSFYLSRRLTRDDLSQEVRLAAPPGAAWPWLVGVYGWRQDEALAQSVMSGGPGGTPLSQVQAVTAKTTLSVFGQTELPVAERWGVGVGLRLDSDGREQHGSAPARSARFNHAAPTLSLIWRPDDDSRAYASWTRGHKAGGFNPGGLPAYRMERTTTWELGGRTRPFEGLDLHLALFRTLVDGQQLTDLDAATTTEYIVNKGRVLIVGLEGGMHARLGGGVGLDLAATGFDGRYKGYQPVKTGPGGVTAAYDLSGRHLQAMPSYKAVAALAGDHPLAEGGAADLRLVWRVAVNAVGPHYWDDFNTARQQSYRTVDLSLGLAAGPATARLFIDNLTDTGYFTNYVPGYRFTPAGGANLAVRGPERSFGGEIALAF